MRLGSYPPAMATTHFSTAFFPADPVAPVTPVVTMQLLGVVLAQLPAGSPEESIMRMGPMGGGFGVVSFQLSPSARSISLPGGGQVQRYLGLSVGSAELISSAV